MDLKNIFEIIERIEKSNLTKFEYSEKDTKIVLEKNNTKSVAVSELPKVNSENSYENEQAKGNIVKSPIVGTFFSKASPESMSFVSVGDNVKKGDVLCIIEAMKLFNEIQSEFDGVVKEILVKDGDMVAYDQPVMIIE